jgi:hypothetical protein
LVVDIAKVIDGMDFLSLIQDSARLEIGTSLQSTLEILISTASRFPGGEVESTLEMIANGLPSTLPGLLLPSRFRVYEAQVEYLLNHAKHCLIEYSSVSAFTLQKLDRLVPIVKYIGKQLDRLADEERTSTARYHDKLVVFDGLYGMFASFLEGSHIKDHGGSFHAFCAASKIAKLAEEKEVEAECLYRMADVIISRGPIDDIDPRSLLVSAHTLNTSARFQQRGSSLRECLRRNDLADILDWAAAVQQNYDLVNFVADAKTFAGVLLARYPCELPDAEKLLEGDFLRGMLKLVRVYHPDKNAARDEDWIWVCEEVTKVHRIEAWLTRRS